MEDIREEQKQFPVLLDLPVQWGEMDAAGHVNNIIYLKWFESVRAEYFLRLEQDVISPEEGEPGFILAKQSCKYLFPLTHPDTVIVGIRVTELHEDRFTMHCKMWSERHQRLVAIANGVVVTYDYHLQQKMALPDELRKQIELLESMSPAKLGKKEGDSTQE